MLRARNGDPVTFPYRVHRQQVAARYATTPAEVDEWPADDLMDALNLLSVTG